jgi:hypothetical protein
MITRIDSFGDNAVNLLLEQFKDKPVFEDLVRLSVELFDDIETDLFDFLSRRISISESEGIQLELLANMIGLSAIGMPSVEYFRSAIEAQTRANSSGATLSDLVSVISQDISNVYIEEGLAEFDIRIMVPISVFVGELEHLRINIARSAGVYFTLQFPNEEIDVSNRFRFDTSGSTFDGPNQFRIETRSAI